MSSPISDHASMGVGDFSTGGAHAVSGTGADATSGATDHTSGGAIEQYRPSMSTASDHSAVVAAPHSGQLVSYNPDAPSEEWGWHGHWSDFAPRGRRILLWLGVAGLLLMLWGNQVSHVEDYFLVLAALLMATWIIMGERARKRTRRIRP